MKKLFVALMLLLAIPMAQAQLLAPVPYRASALTTTALTIKARAGVLQGGTCLSVNGTPTYIQFYDTTAAVVVGTTVPTITLPLVGTAVQDMGGPYSFFNAIKVAATTGVSGSGTPTSALTCAFGFN